MRLIRIWGAIGLLALPVTCAGPRDGIYSGGIQPSPASRVNPAEPGIPNGGTPGR
jgi:hypothetical protein